MKGASYAFLAVGDLHYDREAFHVPGAAADDGVAAIELENPVQDVFDRMWQPVYPELLLDAEAESADGE